MRPHVSRRPSIIPVAFRDQRLIVRHDLNAAGVGGRNRASTAPNFPAEVIAAPQG